jgi:TonB family protein
MARLPLFGGCGRQGGNGSDREIVIERDGAVTDAELERSSDLDAFDRAVMADLRAWHFEAHPGPSSAQTCDRATILYRPHG